jgi:hypothetical protein
VRKSSLSKPFFPSLSYLINSFKKFVFVYIRSLELYKFRMLSVTTCSEMPVKLKLWFCSLLCALQLLRFKKKLLCVSGQFVLGISCLTEVEIGTSPVHRPAGMCSLM